MATTVGIVDELGIYKQKMFMSGFSTTSTVDQHDGTFIDTNHDDLPIDDRLPNAQEGVNFVFWNYFPDLPPPPDLERTQRDESRYKKVSSFTREQPVRIRIFRKNTTVR
jgi:hypothetical protein